MSKALIFDTSVLCVYLQIPNREECGKAPNDWNFPKLERKLKQEESEDTVFVLPLAAIIETGNHISQARIKRRELAKKFNDMIDKTANETSPWVAFGRQIELWDKVGLEKLAHVWGEQAHTKLSLGDATIIILGEFYVKQGYEVEFLTGDAQLKAHEPKPKLRKKRRSER